MPGLLDIKIQRDFSDMLVVLPDVKIYSSLDPEKDICNSIYEIDYKNKELYCLIRDDEGKVILTALDALRQVLKPEWVKAIVHKRVYFLWSDK